MQLSIFCPFISPHCLNINSRKNVETLELKKNSSNFDNKYLKNMVPKILIVYDLLTENTEKVAKLIAEGDK
jgi:hypothetical protein